MIKHYASMLACYPNVRFGIWVLTPPFSPFSSYSIISEKIFGLEFKCIFSFCHQSLCSCTKMAHDQGWSWIKILDLSKLSNDQFELQPRYTFSGNMCPKGISRGTSSIWKVKLLVKRKGCILLFCLKIKPWIFQNHNIRSTLNYVIYLFSFFFNATYSVFWNECLHRFPIFTTKQWLTCATQNHYPSLFHPHPDDKT